VIDPNGHASYPCFATMISEAWRVAEGNVYVRNLKRGHKTLSISCGAAHDPEDERALLVIWSSFFRVFLGLSLCAGRPVADATVPGTA
jgi:hypothetical protein